MLFGPFLMKVVVHCSLIEQWKSADVLCHMSISEAMLVQFCEVVIESE